MIGFKGQTREMIRRDIDVLLSRFKYGIVNLFSENRLSKGLADEELKAWFREEYGWLVEQRSVDVLWRNTDLGVG